MKLNLTVLSPLNIGTGNILTPFVDFVYDEGYIHYIDYDKLGRIIMSEKNSSKIMDEFVAVIKGQADSNKKSKYNLKDFIKDNFNSGENIYKYKLKINNKVTQEISEHIKTSGRPYIPGSSIKGAIRTALLAYHIKQGYEVYKPIGIGEDIFGEYANDVFKYLQISDTEPVMLDNLKIDEFVKYNIEEKSYKNNITLQKEVLSEEVNLNFDINLKAKNISTKFSYLKAGTETQLLEIVNQYYLDYIESYLSRIEIDENFKNLIPKYNKLYNIAKDFKKSNTGALLRLGSGKGFYCNTVLNYYKEKKRNKILKDNLKVDDYEKFPITTSVIIDNNKIIDEPGWTKIEFS